MARQILTDVPLGFTVPYGIINGFGTELEAPRPLFKHPNEPIFSAEQYCFRTYGKIRPLSGFFFLGGGESRYNTISYGALSNNGERNGITAIYSTIIAVDSCSLQAGTACPFHSGRATKGDSSES